MFDLTPLTLKQSLILAVVWLGVGFAILLPWLSNRAMVDSFNHAVPCTQSSPSERSDCYTTNFAVVRKIDWDPQAHPRGGRHDNTLTLDVDGLGERQTVASNSLALFELNVGDRLKVKVWNGKITDITTLGQRSDTAPTHDNPNNETNYYGDYLTFYGIATVVGAVLFAYLQFR